MLLVNYKQLFLQHYLGKRNKRFVFAKITATQQRKVKLFLLPERLNEVET
jgi:hypothetical protein